MLLNNEDKCSPDDDDDDDASRVLHNIRIDTQRSSIYTYTFLKHFCLLYHFNISSLFLVCRCRRRRRRSTCSIVVLFIIYWYNIMFIQQRDYCEGMGVGFSEAPHMVYTWQIKVNTCSESLQCEIVCLRHGAASRRLQPKSWSKNKWNRLSWRRTELQKKKRAQVQQMCTIQYYLRTRLASCPTRWTHKYELYSIIYILIYIFLMKSNIAKINLFSPISVYIRY